MSLFYHKKHKVDLSQCESRVLRIARGSGTHPDEVRGLLKLHKHFEKVFGKVGKNMKGEASKVKQLQVRVLCCAVRWIVSRRVVSCHVVSFLSVFQSWFLFLLRYGGCRVLSFFCLRFFPRIFVSSSVCVEKNRGERKRPLAFDVRHLNYASLLARVSSLSSWVLHRPTPSTLTHTLKENTSAGFVAMSNGVPSPTPPLVLC